MATKPRRGPAGRAMHATERPKNTCKTMRRTMAFILNHYKWHCLAVVICIVLTVLAQLNGTLFLQKLYDSYLSPMLESGSTDFTPLLHKLIQVGAVYAIGVLCSWGYTRLMVNVSQGTMRNFREKLFGHMESLPLSLIHISSVKPSSTMAFAPSHDRPSMLPNTVSIITGLLNETLSLIHI